MKKDRAEKTAMAVPYEEKPSASIRLGKKLDFPKLSIGKTVSVTLTGKITSLNDEEWSRGFSMRVSSIDKDGGMGGDMDRLKKSRSLMDLDDFDED